jgi:hypothetical protein
VAQAKEIFFPNLINERYKAQAEATASTEGFCFLRNHLIDP